MQRVATRPKLTGEAAKQFSRNCFESTDTGSIATGAGYAKGTMYNYSSRKKELFPRFLEEAAGKAIVRYRYMKECNTTRESPRELAKSDVSALSEEETMVGAIMDGARTGTR